MFEGGHLISVLSCCFSPMNICDVFSSYAATKIIDYIRLHSPPMYKTSYYTACFTNDHFIKYIPYLGVIEKLYLYLAYTSVATRAHVGSMCVYPKRAWWIFVCAHMCLCMWGKGGG